MTIQLDDERRAALIRRLQGFYLENLDEELSPFRAEQLLDVYAPILDP